MAHLVAIHQPNFFPWLGYFDKIRRAEIFVFLDDVDYPRSGSGGMGSWINRVRLSIQGDAQWVTCPIKRMARGQSIMAAQIDDGQPWRKKIMRTLQMNYGKAPQYDRTMEFLLPLIESAENNLAAFNISVIHAIAERIGVTTRFVRQSEIRSEGQATERLISLVKAVGGCAYLVGGGAAGYQDDDLIRGAGIDVVYQRFVPECYGSPDRFLPGLSVIDYLMHDGRPLTEAFPDRS
ncbi:WbqC family protein [Bradyrhizobium sp. CB3481]|uniref:WbqC family protein n=1 Tax=Bradyrhizobium sp. CB3481 TaxID=3039158 RepID=UPI0024B196B0|nr:WbqC family protein [Bradyrhizobium sp. CB3481]WFU18959.1 WbqC family protein [Bradyrhizobium sp. CB3481]